MNSMIDSALQDDLFVLCTLIRLPPAVTISPLEQLTSLVQVDIMCSVVKLKLERLLH